MPPGDNPARLTFSFTLFERGPDANLLRVQTDNLDQPFDINSGARLNLGSTAKKLRTLVTYLEIITSSLHKFYGDMSPEDSPGACRPRRHPVEMGDRLFR